LLIGSLAKNHSYSRLRLPNCSPIASRNLIRLWIRKYEAGEFTDELAEAVYIAQYERKIAELERKVGQLTMEVDLLKKGRSWDANPTKRATPS
jgi:hypothetical protein